jgi:hypothetical protein
MLEWYYLEPFQFRLLRDWLLGLDLQEGDPALTNRFDVYNRNLAAKTTHMYDPLNPNPEEVGQLAAIWQNMFREVYHVSPIPWEPKQIDTSTSLT